MSPTGPNKFQRGITPERIHVNILQGDGEKCGKLNLKKRKYLVCNQVNRNKKCQTWSVLCQDKFIYQNASQYSKTGEESPENWIFAKGNNSIKSRSNTTKLKLDLYYVKTNPSMKFQVKMSKDDKEKCGKTKF